MMNKKFHWFSLNNALFSFARIQLIRHCADILSQYKLKTWN